MFPISSTTALLLLTMAVAAGASVYVARRGWSAPWRVAQLLVLGALWPWPVAMYLGLHHYTIGMAFYASAWTTGALSVGLVWGVLARHIPVSGPVVLVALFPALAGSAYLLERQRVPNALCATEVEFHIGDLRLTVPRSVGLRSVAADGAPAQKWEGSYSDWLGGKPDVRALCRATEGGRTPVGLAHAWLSFTSVRQAVEDDCESAISFPSRSAVCGALARARPTVVQFYARPDGLPVPTLQRRNCHPGAGARRA